MSNEITTNKYLTNDDYFAAVAGEANTLKGGGGGKAFLKFDGNNGLYSYGADDTELPLGSQLVLNPRSYRRGWVIWKGGKVVHEDMKLLEQGAPTAQGDLPNHGPYNKSEGPSEQYTIDLATTEDPFVEMVFQANNTSKRRALAALLKDFGGSYKLHPGKFPVVELDAREFPVEIDGRKVTKFAPDFKIVAWIDEAEMAAMKEGTPADYDPEPEALPAPEETAPVETKAAAKPAAAAKAAAPRARGRF